MKPKYTYAIEKDVQMPKQDRWMRKYPFAGMAVGDMFTFDSNEYQRVAAAVQYFSRTNAGKRFSIRKIPERNGRHGCWRMR